MDKSFDQNETFRIKEVFEVKEEHRTGHDPGLVVVLDRSIVGVPLTLVGGTAVIHTPNGVAFRVRIEEAKDHLAATSLFFRNMKIGDVPVGSEITITLGET